MWHGILWKGEKVGGESDPDRRPKVWSKVFAGAMGGTSKILVVEKQLQTTPKRTPRLGQSPPSQAGDKPAGSANMLA